MNVRQRFERRAAEAEHRRLVATVVEPEGACARAEREAKEMRSHLRGVAATGIRDTGATSTCKPYNHGKDCRRWMTEAEFERDWAGSEAVLVRAGHGDETRSLVHLCGKAGPKCRIAAVFNRIPDSRVSKSDTTDMVATCASRSNRPLTDVHRGYVQGALRDCQTAYYMAKPRVNPQGMTEA